MKHFKLKKPRKIAKKKIINLARLWVFTEDEVLKIYNEYKDKKYYDYEECKKNIERDLIKNILSNYSERAELLIADENLSREIALNILEWQEKQRS